MNEDELLEFNYRNARATKLHRAKSYYGNNLPIYLDLTAAMSIQPYTIDDKVSGTYITNIDNTYYYVQEDYDYVRLLLN